MGGDGGLRVYDRLNERVFVLKLTPEMDLAVFDLLKRDHDAIILETFGIGGIPDYGDYQRALFDWWDSGRTLVVTTQVPEEGCDLGVYEVGRAYAEHPRHPQGRRHDHRGAGGEDHVGPRPDERRGRDPHAVLPRGQPRPHGRGVGDGCRRMTGALPARNKDFRSLGPTTGSWPAEADGTEGAGRRRPVLQGAQACTTGSGDGNLFPPLPVVRGRCAAIPSEPASSREPGR